MNDTRRFAAFILTHGRPDRVFTYESLRKAGYTGDIYLITDNEDDTLDQYRNRYDPASIITINLSEIAKQFDIADTIPTHNSVIYKRVASFEIAKQLGLTHFAQLDDDYGSSSANGFRYRTYSKETDHFTSVPVKSLDRVFDAMITLLEVSKAMSISMSQGGDWLGGNDSNAARNPMMRKSMNCWVCATDRPITYVGRLNDDVNTYVINGMRGELFFTASRIQLDQKATQQNAGGMTDLYLETGTYTKSFYTVMLAPSCTTVKPMGGHSHQRLHHRIRWDNAVPKIISDKHRKPR